MTLLGFGRTRPALRSSKSESCVEMLARETGSATTVKIPKNETVGRRVRT